MDINEEEVLWPDSPTVKTYSFEHKERIRQTEYNIIWVLFVFFLLCVVLIGGAVHF